MMNIFTSCTWNPNDPCFDPCFGGLTFKNRGQLGSLYLYSQTFTSTFFSRLYVFVVYVI